MRTNFIAPTMIVGITGLLLLTVGVTGCAKVEVKRLTSENSYTEGVRFYRPAPYLLITPQEKDKAQELRIIYLPDTSQEYVVHTTNGIGVVTANVTLDNGWNLTGINRTIDSKVPETITAIGEIIPKMASVVKAAETKLDPGLYRIQFDEKGDISELKAIFHFKK